MDGSANHRKPFFAEEMQFGGRYVTCLFSLLLMLAANASSYLDSVLAVPYHDRVADLRMARTGLHKAMFQARLEGNGSAEGDCMHLLATMHYLEGQYDSSMYYNLAAIDRYRELGDQVQLGAALCGLGHQTKRRDLQEAFRRFRQGLKILEAENATDELKVNYDNYGVLHEMNEDLDSAEHFYRKSLLIKLEQQDSVGIPYSLNKLGTVHLLRNEFDEALQKFKQAESIRERLNDRLGLAEQQTYFGDLFAAWGQDEQAAKFYQAGFDQASEVNYTFLQQYALEQMALCLERSGDLAGALDATRRSEALKDSLLNEKNSQTILELQERFNVLEKDQQINELAQQAERRNLLMWISISTLALVIAIGILLRQAQMKRQRAERDAAVIAERDRGLAASFESAEKERQRIARELHDGIGQQLTATRFRLEELVERSRTSDPGILEETGELLRMVDTAAQETRDLSHQMMPAALRDLSLSSAIRDMLNKAFDRTEVEHTFEVFGNPDGIHKDTGTAVYRIAQELIGNVLKHADAKHVSIQLMARKDRLIILVEDDGKGVEREVSNGIGLINIRERVRILGGSFELAPSVEKGTLATVRVPLENGGEGDQGASG